MKYFTPQRYVAFNSADDSVADRANDDWEQTIAAYRQHLKSVQSRLPIKVRHDGQVHVLTYLLVAEPLVSRPIESPVFETDQPHWLYDEFDLDDAGTVTHRILLSDGPVLSLRFVAFDLLAPLPKPATKKRRRAVAA